MCQSRLFSQKNIVDQLKIRMKLSKSQTLVVNVVLTRFVVSDFVQQLRRQITDVPDLHFTLIDGIGFSAVLVLIENANPKAPKREKTAALTKNERQQLQRSYKQGGAEYGPVRKLVKTNNL